MKRTLIIAMAATGLAFAGPVAAHHPSPMTTLIEENMPPNALLQHNLMMEELEQGVVTMSGTPAEASTSGLDMDPSNSASSRGPMNSDSGTGDVIDRWEEQLEEMGLEEMGGFGPAQEPLFP